MDNDESVKIYAKQYTSQKGTKYYWGKYGGYEVRIFRGKDHEGTPSLDVHVKTVTEETRDVAPTQAEQDGDGIPF